nr:hypothetical protein [uncultured Flavobacterium sp.]
MVTPSAVEGPTPSKPIRHCDPDSYQEKQPVIEKSSDSYRNHAATLDWERPTGTAERNKGNERRETA